jgi:putative membrane protein insertion efficiency factor
MLLFFALFPVQCSASWQPWDLDKDVSIKEQYMTSVPQIVTIDTVRFYQMFISPLLRPDKCNFTPTCSRYSIEAVRQYGAAKGSVMTFDRIMRDNPWAWEGRYEVREGRLYDPPSSGNYWSW